MNSNGFQSQTLGKFVLTDKVSLHTQKKESGIAFFSIARIWILAADELGAIPK